MKNQFLCLLDDGTRKEDYTMSKGKHLTLDDRKSVQMGLQEGRNFQEIAREIGKDPSTEYSCAVKPPFRDAGYRRSRDGVPQIV